MYSTVIWSTEYLTKNINKYNYALYISLIIYTYKNRILSNVLDIKYILYKNQLHKMISKNILLH